MSILADTNILLRRTQPDHPSHTLAVESVAKLLAAGVCRILTFNTDDFARYDVDAIHPSSLT
ncbi:MAG: hypothetical protein M3Y24_02865 [Acidobacteriota bacterium]|nr:hypothetical protein [Acidobacteriota bacterium]